MLPANAIVPAKKGRWLASLTLISFLFLGGCMQSEQVVPDNLLQHLTGTWQDQDGLSTVKFYDDLSVKLSLKLPNQRVPLRLLSTVEMMKDHAIGISLGDRWKGPARITMTTPDANDLTLHLPGDKKGEETLFHLHKVGTKQTTTKVTPQNDP